MALTGSYTHAFCSRNGAKRYYLKYTWEAKQDIVNNKSNVTVKCYIGSYGNGYGISSSASKSGSLTVNGTKYSFSSSTAISSGGSRLIYTSPTISIAHNSDGTKSFAISLSFNPAVTISGSYQGNESTGSTTYTLNTIARTSSISCSGNWTFPFNKTISIARQDSSFRHDVRLYIGNMSTPFKSWSKTANASFSTSFTADELKSIASKFGTSSATPTVATKIEVDTYSGSTKIGSATPVTGKCTATKRSTTTFTNNFNIGATVSGKISENNGAYTHTLIMADSSGNTIHTILNKSTALTWSLNTGDIASTLYAKTPNSNTYTGKIYLYTYYSGVQVGNVASSNWTWNVTNSNPTFSPTITYKDTNATISGLTTSDQYIVQNKSTLRVTVAVTSTTLAAKNGATLKTIQAMIGGKTKKATYVSGQTSYTFDFGTINASSNQSCTIQAIDSRGNKTSASKTITCFPYSAPRIVPIIERTNRFSTSIQVSFTGSYSIVNAGGTARNTITKVGTYLTVDNGIEQSEITHGVNTNSGYFKSQQTSTPYTVAETSIASVRIVARDTFGSTATATIAIPTGIPTMYIDADKGNIAFNALPDMNKSANMKLGTTLDLATNQYWLQTDSTKSGKQYGVNANNSDLIGLNALFWQDTCNASNYEGMFFPNSNASITNDSTVANDYSRLYMVDGQLWASSTATGTRVNIGNTKILDTMWTGAWWMNASQSLTASHGIINITNFPIGWLLVFSDYNADTSTASNADNFCYIIPKNYVLKNSGEHMIVPVPYAVGNTGGNTPLYFKRLYVSTTTITGHADNYNSSYGGYNDVVLTAVYGI